MSASELMAAVVDEIAEVAELPVETEKLSQVLGIFHKTFDPSLEGIRLRGGFPEPFYQARKDLAPAEIRFTRDYLNSCFHEVAHWCIAGKQRRDQDDYGYWYRPDGRNGKEQDAFFKAEAGPQALEWAFATACGEQFRMSCDNLAGEVLGEEAFSAELGTKLARYLEKGFPPRGERFLRALMAFYQPEILVGDQRTWLEARTLALTMPLPLPLPQALNLKLPQLKLD
jgi:elongation factor P hydroxylase